MNTSQWMDLTVLERKKYNYLCEVLDLTQQLGQSIDRNDAVSMRILVSMRQDPILALDELNRSIQQRKAEFSPQEQERISALLSGAARTTAPKLPFATRPDWPGASWNGFWNWIGVSVCVWRETNPITLTNK